MIARHAAGVLPSINILIFVVDLEYYSEVKTHNVVEVFHTINILSCVAIIK